MAGAVARVEQKIIITGADNASAAVKAAQKSLGGLRKEAGKTKKATKDLAKAPTFDAAKLQQGTQRAGGALAALSAAMGPTAGGLAEVGKEATAFGSTAAVLPGPIGLAVAAVAGLAAGIYFMNKRVSEAQARLAQLGDANTLKLKEKFDLGVDGAVKLTQALNNLNDGAVRPADDLIAKVIRRAKAVGGDPVAAVTDLATAWKKGAAAVLEYQRVKGQIDGLDRVSLEAAAKGLGIDLEVVGVARKQLDARGKVNQAFLDAVEAQRQLTAAERKYSKLADDGFRGRGRKARANASIAANAIAVQLAGLRKQAKARNDAAKAAQAALTAETQLAAAEKGRGIVASFRENQAQLAATKDLGNGIRLQSIAEQREVVEGKLTALVKKRSKLSGQEYANQFYTLKVELQSLDLKQRTIISTADAERKAQRAARTAAARANAAAASELKLKIATARANRDGLLTERERISLLDKAQAKEEATAKAIPNAKVRTLALLAIEEVYQTKRAALERQIQTEKGKASTESLKVLNDDTKRRAEAAAKRLTIKKKLADEEAKINDQLKAMDVDSFKRAGDALAAVGAAFASSGAASGSIGAEQFGQSLSIAAKAAADLNKNMDDTPKAAAGVAKALGGIGQVAVDAETQRTTKQLEAEKQRALATATTEEQRAAIVDDFEKRKAAAVEAGERRKAAILALMEVANAAASFPNIPLMVAHGAAAVLYGSIAGGLVGGGAPTPGAAGAGGGGFTAPTTAAATGGGGGGGAGQSITINFNQPLTTQQNIGKAVKGALNSISSTGHGAARGV